MNAAFVALRVSEPPREVEIILREVTGLTAHTQPRRKARHDTAHGLPHGISALLHRLLHPYKLFVTRGTRTTSRLDRRLENPEGFHVGASGFVDGLDGRQATVHIACSPRQRLVSRPPFWASGFRGSEDCTSPQASARRRPGGCRGPP